LIGVEVERHGAGSPPRGEREAEGSRGNLDGGLHALTASAKS